MPPPIFEGAVQICFWKELGVEVCRRRLELHNRSSTDDFSSFDDAALLWMVEYD